jgi:hypothetical protein
MFCSEHLEPVHGGVEVGALGSNKTCAQIIERHNRVWDEISWRW